MLNIPVRQSGEEKKRYGWKALSSEYRDMGTVGKRSCPPRVQEMGTARLGNIFVKVPRTWAKIWPGLGSIPVRTKEVDTTRLGNTLVNVQRHGQRYGHGWATFTSRQRQRNRH